MKKHTILLLEDTPEDQQIFRHYVSQLPFLDIAGVFGEASAALPVLQTGTIDVFVSDIYMPQQTGIDLLRTLTNPPPVILTTASVQHPIEAYELGVVDYLVKPFSFERFKIAINRAIAHQEQRVAEANRAIWLKEGRGTVQVLLNQIRYVEANGPYCKLHLTDRVLLVNYVLTSLLDQLPADEFVQVHRSYAVAVAHINRIHTLSVELDKNTTVPIGFRYRNALRQVANQRPR
jgi:DNA-binding LytR/AlgR family response regulator